MKKNMTWLETSSKTTIYSKQIKTTEAVKLKDINVFLKKACPNTFKNIHVYACHKAHFFTANMTQIKRT